MVDFIDNANINDIIHDELLSGFSAKYGQSDPAQPEALANTYAEMGFGTHGDPACNATCLDLPLGDQMQCQLDCAKSCIQTCSDTATTQLSDCTHGYDASVTACQQLSSISKATCLTNAGIQRAQCTAQVPTDQILCTTQCSCFMVSGPNGGAWKQMEAMFTIKFCSVPVQPSAIPSKKTVS